MRGPSKALSKYGKHRASGQAIVKLNGRDVYLGPHGTKASHAEYDRVIAEWLANGRRLPTKDCHHQVLSIFELCALYLRFAQGYYVKNGKQTDEVAGIKAAIKYLTPLYGKTPVNDFGPLALDVVRDQIIAAGNTRSYVNKTAIRIRRMFKWAVSKELVPVEIHQALTTVVGLKKGKTAAREADPILPVADEVVYATIEHCSQTVTAMIQIQRLTGCRPGEVRSMKPCEVDRSQSVWRYTPGSHKMEHKGRDRVILIGPKAQAFLLPYLLRDENAVCFEKPRGGMFARWNYNEKINQACDKAFPAPKGTKGEALKAWRKEHRWAPNRLRHTAATAVRQVYGLEAAQAVLGHANADITQVYAERDLLKAAEVMAEVG